MAQIHNFLLSREIWWAEFGNRALFTRDSYQWSHIWFLDLGLILCNFHLGVGGVDVQHVLWHLYHLPLVVLSKLLFVDEAHMGAHWRSAAMITHLLLAEVTGHKLLVGLLGLGVDGEVEVVPDPAGASLGDHILPLAKLIALKPWRLEAKNNKRWLNLLLFCLPSVALVQI